MFSETEMLTGTSAAVLGVGVGWGHTPPCCPTWLWIKLTDSLKVQKGKILIGPHLSRLVFQTLGAKTSPSTDRRGLQHLQDVPEAEQEAPGSLFPSHLPGSKPAGTQPRCLA